MIGTENGQTLVVGPLLFSFASFDSWVNQAQRIWKKHRVRGDVYLFRSDMRRPSECCGDGK